MASCTTAADCPAGQGCCGNDILESPETCDDGNNIDNDACHNNCMINPTGTAIVGCDNLTGPNIIPASIKVTKFKDTKPLGKFDRWKTSGTFIYAQGLTIKPSTQKVTITYNNTGSGTLFQSTISPGDCPTTPCFVQNGVKPQWKFLDKLADLVAAPSWHKGKLKIKNNSAKIGLDGRTVDLFTAAQAGMPPSMRQTIRIGDVCVTGVVNCLANSKNTSLKCSLAP
jgi:cysteine-rich repeat protein